MKKLTLLCHPVLACFILSLLLSACCSAQVQFPLKLSANGRYLADKNNKPFLIKEISSWGLIQALSEADESAFIDSVKKKGFNTLRVSIISWDTRFAGGPPDWQGVSPFKTQWDFSTYNASYFEHADRVLKIAERKGMLVLLVPCYLGYKGDVGQGWFSKLLDNHNDTAKSRAYGRFLGNRYKGAKNIIWVACGDNPGTGNVFPHMNNIILGIREFDKQHLWTGHFESAQGTNWSSGAKLYSSYIDLDGLYDFTESALGTDAPQYKTELEKFGGPLMIFQLDQSYEQDIPHGPDNENYQWIRRKNYDGLLSGCAGTSFSPGQKDNQCYVFKNWQPLMNTTGMQQVSYCFKLFGSRAWYKLVPDKQSNILTGGRGQFGDIGYACAAITIDANTFIAYLPDERAVTVNMGGINGKSAKAWWFNPANGIATMIGTYPTNGQRSFKPVGNGDWLLVIDNASLNLPTPGN